MQAVNILAVACHTHERAVACSHAVERNFAFSRVASQGLLHDRRIRREQCIAQRIEHLERTVRSPYDQKLFALVLGIIHEHDATRSRGKSDITRELSALDTPVVNANGHADRLCAKVHDAVTHEGVRSLFDASIFRHLHRNLDPGVAALCRHRICIARRANCLDRIELLLGILVRLAQVRQQVRPRTVIVGVFTDRILERLADTQDTVGLDHRNPELVIAQCIAAPEIRNAIFQGLTQVPVVHAPHHDTARRQSRVVAAHIQNNTARLLGVLLALSLDADTILENQV